MSTDYTSLIAQYGINVSFTPKLVHVWTNDGKLQCQNNAASVKLSKVGNDRAKALHMAIDKLISSTENKLGE